MILYGELALFLMAVIATLVSEASVERIFSHTKLILHASRMRMGERPTAAQTYVKFNGVALDGTSDHAAPVPVVVPGFVGSVGPAVIRIKLNKWQDVKVDYNSMLFGEQRMKVHNVF